MQAVQRIAVPDWLAGAPTRAVFSALAGGAAAEEAGAIACCVGGCVRDHLLGKPVADIDIATSLDPDTVTARLEAAGIKVVPTGLQHGTVTAVTAERHYEITTLRVDVQTHGRRADVAFTGDWEADAQRRDFTINALYLGPEGALYDPTGGLADLDARIVRFIGAAQDRIREDYLRILRFFRFHARFGRGRPEADAWQAASVLADHLLDLSGERLRDETLKILETDGAPAVWPEMAAAGVLAVYLPQWQAGASLAALAALEGALAWPGAGLRRLAAAYSGAGENAGDAAEATARRLRLSNEARHYLRTVTPGDEDLRPGAEGPVLRRGLYRHRDGPAADLAVLACARAGARAAEAKRLVAAVAAETPPAFPLKGRDLLALGYPRGPAIGATLRALEQWWIARDFCPDRAMLLAEAERRRKAGETSDS